VSCAADARQVAQALSRIDGVRAAGIDQGGKVTIEYDLMRFSVARLDQEIQALGYALDDSVWSRVRRGWLRFSEQNDIDNLRAPARPCCSNPEEIVDRIGDSAYRPRRCSRKVVRSCLASMRSGGVSSRTDLKRKGSSSSWMCDTASCRLARASHSS
jgi:copper chaperone CopZ